MTNWNEIGRKLFQRWGATAYPTMDQEQVGKLLGISIGLGSLFNEDATAERRWMQTPHAGLRGQSRPISRLLAGQIDEVAELVLRERNVR